MRKETVAAFLWLIANLNVISSQSGNFLHKFFFIFYFETPIESRRLPLYKFYDSNSD